MLIYTKNPCPAPTEVTAMLNDFEIIKSDWERYPYKKCHKFYNIANQIFMGREALTLIALSGLCQSFTFQFWWRLSAKRSWTRLIPRLIFTHYSRKWGIYTISD